MHKKIINPIFAFILFVFSSSAFSAQQSDAKVGYLDLFLLALSEDVQNYVLAIQLLENNNTDLKHYLGESLESKLDDLILYLPESANKQTIEIICKAQDRVADDIKSIANNCKSNDLCEKVFYINRICVAGGSSSKMP